MERETGSKEEISDSLSNLPDILLCTKYPLIGLSIDTFAQIEHYQSWRPPVFRDSWHESVLYIMQSVSELLDDAQRVESCLEDRRTAVASPCN